ncbi:MAG: hypothetical protein IPL26_30190 [Leptospiraceae bacterium]|nr:hypothetical protein [Leptospiraceae bacterium]
MNLYELLTLILLFLITTMLIMIYHRFTIIEYLAKEIIAQIRETRRAMK